MADVFNIDDRGVDLRLGRAVWGVGLTLVAMIGMSKAGAPTITFALLFLPLFATANLTLQGLFRT
jgi:hypothetical protein